MKKKQKESFEKDEAEENVYSGDAREDLVESGGISPEEEGFMTGYDDAEDDDEKKKDEEESEED